MAVKWYEFESTRRNTFKVANPTFRTFRGDFVISDIVVEEAEFNRVLAEWEADQQIESEPDTQPEKPQWKPKVGDWVRVKDVQVGDCVRGFTMFGGAMHDNCGIIGKVTRLRLTAGVAKVGEWWFVYEWLEPATPQPIDKLGWWLIDGEPELIIRNDSSSRLWESLSNWFYAGDQGIFLVEITDEELINCHRNGIIPKCPVEVQS